MFLQSLTLVCPVFVLSFKRHSAAYREAVRSSTESLGPRFLLHPLRYGQSGSAHSPQSCSAEGREELCWNLIGPVCGRTTRSPDTRFQSDVLSIPESRPLQSLTTASSSDQPLTASLVSCLKQLQLQTSIGCFPGSPVWLQILQDYTVPLKLLIGHLSTFQKSYAVIFNE